MSASDLDRSVVEADQARMRSPDLYSKFPFARLRAWAQIKEDVSFVERRKVALSGIYTLVSVGRLAAAAA